MSSSTGVAAIHNVTDDNFETEVLKCETAVLVDYWAEWCGPCKQIAPILEQIAKEYEGRLKIAKINVDENRNIPAKFGIKAIPTLMLFKNGEVVDRFVGVQPKTRLQQAIDAAKG